MKSPAEALVVAQSTKTPSGIRLKLPLRAAVHKRKRALLRSLSIVARGEVSTTRSPMLESVPRVISRGEELLTMPGCLGSGDRRSQSGRAAGVVVNQQV